MAQTSLATPRTLKQSPLFGVRSSSIIFSSRSRKHLKFSPKGAEESNSIIPSCSSESPISASEQIMPTDSTPRNLAFFILKLFGKTAPTVATATLRPLRTFGAPQIICRLLPLPISTMQRLNLSALGCLSQLTTTPTTTPSKSGATGPILSTSRPAMVNFSAKSISLTFGSDHSLSHEVDIFICNSYSLELIQKTNIIFKE